MSELLDKQMNAQKEKNFWGSSKLPQANKSVKNDVCVKMLLKEGLNVIEGRKPFIMPIQNTGENDLHKLRGNDYGYNEGTICLVNR